MTPDGVTCQPHLLVFVLEDVQMRTTVEMKEASGDFWFQGMSPLPAWFCFQAVAWVQAASWQSSQEEAGARE